MYRFFSIFERDSLWTTVDKSSRIAPLPLRVPHQSNNPNLAPANQSAGVLFLSGRICRRDGRRGPDFSTKRLKYLAASRKNISKGIIRKNCAADFPLRRCRRAATCGDQSLFRQRHMRSAVASAIRCETLSMSGGSIFRRFTRTNRDKPPRGRVHSCRQKIGGIKLAPLVLEIFF